MNWFQQHKKAAWFSLSAAALLLAGVVYFLSFLERANKASAQGDGGVAKQSQSVPLRVQVIEPKAGGVERLVRRPATVQSFEYANLYAKVSGYLSHQKVDIGSRVKKDDVLAEVYAPAFSTSLYFSGA